MEVGYIILELRLREGQGRTIKRIYVRILDGKYISGPYVLRVGLYPSGRPLIVSVRKWRSSGKVETDYSPSVTTIKPWVERIGPEQSTALSLLT